MKEVTHTRRGKQIIDLATGVVQDFKFINEAKRASRVIQSTGGTLRRLQRKLADRLKASSVRMGYVDRVGS